MLRGIVRICVAAISVMCTLSALATDRYYPDISTTSNDARYKLEAKSPKNQNSNGRPRAFADDFTYTLTDSLAGKVVWTHRQRDTERSPIRAWLHDSGWVVVRTAGDTLLAFDPADGVIRGKVNILDQFSSKESDKFVRQTSAGPQWSTSSRWYFADIGDSLCFVVRAHWGRRIIMAVATGSLVKDRENSAAKQERQWVLSTLETLVPQLLSGSVDSQAASEIQAAIDIAAKDNIQEAVPFLRKAEESRYSSRSGFIPIFGGDKPLPADTIDPFSYQEFTIRYKAQTALRKLGYTPSEAPALSIGRGIAEHAISINRTSPLDSRAVTLPKLQVGESPIDVLRSAGGPDRLYYGKAGIAWEYHIDGQDAHSLRVFWSQVVPPTITRFEKITPPSWVGEEDVDW